MNVLAPSFSKVMNDDKMDWAVSNKTVSKSTLFYDSQDLNTLLMAISRANPDRAGKALSQLLSDKANVWVKNIVVESLSSSSKSTSDVNQFIIDGIRESIDHHTTSSGTRTIAEETFVKNVALACVFVMEQTGEDISNNALEETLGISCHQLSLARETVQQLIIEDSVVTGLQRKRRKDYVKEKVKVYLFSWLRSDDNTRLDTNQCLVDVEHPVTGDKVPVHKRIWRIVNKEAQHLLFLNSDEYASFQRENEGATIGYTTWSQVLKEVNTFVTNPKPESCVDEKISGLEHMMVAGVRN